MSAGPDSPVAAVEAHIDALTARRLDEAMARYDERSVLRHPGGVERGAPAIRAHLVELLAASPVDADVEREGEALPDGRVELRWRLVRRGDGGPVVVATGTDFFRLDGDVIVDQEVVAGH